MSHADILQIAVGLVCFFMAGVIVYRFRHYLRPRNEGETMGEFVARTREEKRLDRIAKNEMLGRWTITLNAASMVLLMAAVWLSKYETMVIYAVMGYLLIGFYVTKEAARAARRPDYVRLGLLDRFTYRMLFAWAWPFHFLKPKRE